MGLVQGHGLVCCRRGLVVMVWAGQGTDGALRRGTSKLSLMRFKLPDLLHNNFLSDGLLGHGFMSISSR